MLDLFEKRSIKDFSDKVQKVVHLMTISRKVRVVGSAGLKNLRYASDYDLQELFERNFDTDEALDLIYQMFKDKFKRAEADPSIFITDLKCGIDSDGEPLRWNKQDIQKGTKQMKDGRIIKFQDCILQKTTFKMDVVKIIDGVFTEFSDNYYIKLGEDANFFPHDLQKDHIANDLKHSYDEYFYVYRNLFKGLKRAFSYYNLIGRGKYHDILKKLVDFFNSATGLFYQIKGQIGTILLVMENDSNFREPKTEDIKKNIKLILDTLQFYPVKNIKDKLEVALKSKSRKKIQELLVSVEDDLLVIVNRATLDWIIKNKDVPIY